MRMMSVAGVLVSFLIFGFGMASGADQLVLGKLILIKHPIPGQLQSRRFKVYAMEYGGATIVGDPTVGGATLRVIANGGTPSDETFDLPASHWTGRTNSLGTAYYKYRDYDPETGFPSERRLKMLGLDSVARDLAPLRAKYNTDQEKKKKKYYY